MKRSLRFLSILLTLCMVLGLFPATVFAAANMPFTDVKETDWFYDAVRYVYENGMMSGTGGTTFSPDIVTTRGMIVTILHRMESTPAATGEEFADVPAGEYYSKAVAWASANGIVSGYGDGNFGPDDAITREQMAAILYRYAQYKGYDTSSNGSIFAFADGSKVSSYAVDAMGWAVGAGLISGVGGNMLDPTGSATRAQVATILMRFCEYGFGMEALLLDLLIAGKEENKDTSRNHPSNKSDDVYFTVSFNSNGGSFVEPQMVLRGESATQPQDPERKDYIFIGWYCGNGYSSPYNFDTPVVRDIVVYAKWYSKLDTADTDGDGLPDSLEKEFGTDPSKADTDNDGLSDYIELNWLNYDPTSPDTDNNGISDADEDPDGDGLTNIEEEQLGTNPITTDSDFDYLSDYDEVYVYHTDPLNEDTDGDGVNDGLEIAIGSDPLVAETWFETSEDTGEADEYTPVTASAKVVTDAVGAGTLQVSELMPMDNLLLSQSIPGYLGAAYDFSTDGILESAEITFYYDTSLGEIGDDFQPRIYYFDEDTGLLEELPDQVVTDGMVSVEVPHFSTYILLNKVEFDKVWETEIRNPQDQSSSQYTGIDVVFVIDSSGSMTWNDSTGLRKEAAKAFVDKLGADDRAAVIDFDNYATVYQGFTDDHTSLYSAIERVDSSGGTSLSAGISKAIGLFTGSDYGRTDAYKYIIFMTDGDGSYNTSYTSLAADNDIVIYTIGLGSEVRESTLKAIADGTGGKYYFASTADALSGIYVEVSFETVDYTTDSNNDGISDYYTKLLNDGVLPTSTGGLDLIGVTKMYGEDCDDWDGDGLKNGEEIQVCAVGNMVYVKMESDPLVVDSDGDGYTDYQEKQLGTPPMKYNSNAYSDLKALEDDSRYIYIDVANDSGLLADINAFFDWQKTKESKSQLTDFFYDYASQETIDNNQDAIASLKVREQYLEYVQAASKVLKAAKDICSAADDVKDIAKGIDDSKEVDEFIEAVNTKKVKIEDISDQTMSDRKRVIDAMNTEEWDGDTLNDLLSDIDSIRSLAEELKEIFNISNAASFSKDLASQIKIWTSVIADSVAAVKTVYGGFKYVRLANEYQNVSQGYQKFLESKGTSSAKWFKTGVSVVLEFVDMGIEILEISNTYGKIKANRDAYIGYTELMYSMKDCATYDYVRIAADDLAAIVQDESWETYEQELLNAKSGTILSHAALAVLTVAAVACPYVEVAKLVLDIVKLSIDVIGFSNDAKLYVSCRTMQAVSDGCIDIIETLIDTDSKNDQVFYYELACRAYMVQLAQCRLVGNDYVRQRWEKYDGHAFFARLFSGMNKDDIEAMFKMNAGFIYNNARYLRLELSPNLPYYSDFN